MRKSGFWFFQIIGWALFLLVDYFSYYQEIISLKAPYFWLLSFVAGFCISLLLRKWYIFVYKAKKDIYITSLIIIISSFAAAALWYVTTIVVTIPLRLIVFDGADYAIITGSLYNAVTRILSFSWPYLIWSVLYFGIKYWIELIEAKEHSEKAFLLAQKSQLQMLRYQLNPHFLFNSLNSIQALVYDNPKHADKMISELSEFLRYTMQDKDKIFIPLGEEVKIAEKYLSMEKTRFPDRLAYEIEVTNEASKIEVIAFILQPFVENAVKHGLKSSPDGVKVYIKAAVELQKLYIEVMNSGQWIDNKKNNGIGIQNVLDRLNMAYPDKYSMHIMKEPDSVGVRIEILL